MQQSVQEALELLRGLGTVAGMQALAARGCTPLARPKFNSHIHLPPNFSAFDSVEQAVALADEQNVRVVGVTNYYDYRVYADFVKRARARGIFPLFGLEIISLIDPLVRAGIRVNDPKNPGRMYICGKGAIGVADPSPRAAELLGIIRRNDTKRMAEMTRKVADIFSAAGLDTGIDAEAIVDMIVRRHDAPPGSVTIQERHIAMAFQEALFRLVPPHDRPSKLVAILGTDCKADPKNAVAIQGEIRTHLMKAGRPAFIAETFLSFEEARQLILELRAIPCYPTLADGASPICEYENPPEKLIADLRVRKIYAAELIPIRNQPDVLERYVKAFRAAGIIVVAGTEHNTLDLLPLEPLCIGGQPIAEELRGIFWEGACVVAAHQFLLLHGEPGFVDDRGNPNADYSTAEARIEAFRRLGAAVIQRYFETAGQEHAA